MTVHLAVAVLALDEACVGQVYTDTVKLLVLVHFSLSYAVNYRVRVDA